MGATNDYQSSEIAKGVIKYCLSTDRKFIFISGNGGSGKTELGKILSQEAAKFGHANVLNMDDFVVDTKLRNSATPRFTTSFAASYFLPSIKAILFNLEKGNSYYHWPKKANSQKECRLLHGDAVLTIVEGVGTVFLDKDEANSINIFLVCKPEIEISRRSKRKQASNEQSKADVKQAFNERNNQYKAFVEPHADEHELVLESLEDFSLKVIQDKNGILS